MNWILSKPCCVAYNSNETQQISSSMPRRHSFACVDETSSDRPAHYKRRNSESSFVNEKSTAMICNLNIQDAAACLKAQLLVDEMFDLCQEFQLVNPDTCMDLNVLEPTRVAKSESSDSPAPPPTNFQRKCRRAGSTDSNQSSTDKQCESGI